jgi:hypothetical protein
MTKNLRLHAFKHNSLKGHATMMQANCRNIINSPSATQESKLIAVQILELAIQLRVSLGERVD